MGFLHEVALGCGECGGPTDDGEEDDERVIRRKGLGNERTFRPVHDCVEIKQKVRLSEIIAETFSLNAIEQTQEWRQPRVDFVEAPRHRADAVAGTTSRRMHGAPEI